VELKGVTTMAVFLWNGILSSALIAGLSVNLDVGGSAGDRLLFFV